RWRFKKVNPYFTHLRDNKITTEWKAAPKSVALRQHYQEFKKTFKTKNRDYFSKTAQEVESSLKTKEKKESKEEAMSIKTFNKQKIKDISYNTDDEMQDTQKEAEQATTFSEAELTTRDELALDGSFFKDNNKENNSPQENILSAIPMEEDFTT
ncbi:10517_t:CDS:2, partial [Racocetra persica]